MKKSTTRIELVETANIALSIKRVREAPGSDHMAWRRALWHAIELSAGMSNWEERKRLREALNLP